jgi:hypothetical protein
MQTYLTVDGGGDANSNLNSDLNNQPNTTSTAAMGLFFDLWTVTIVYTTPPIERRANATSQQCLRRQEETFQVTNQRIIHVMLKMKGAAKKTEKI